MHTDTNQTYDPRAIAVIDWFIWLWGRICAPFKAVWKGVTCCTRASVKFCKEVSWTTVAFLALGIIIAKTTHSFYEVSTRHPNVFTFETDDIVIRQGQYIAEEQSGETMKRIATEIYVYHANLDIVKKYFNQFGHKVDEDGTLRQYDRAGQRRGWFHHDFDDNTHMGRGGSKTFIIVGDPPPFIELRIRGNTATMIRDPSYKYRPNDKTDHFRVDSNVEELGTRLRYNEPYPEYKR